MVWLIAICITMSLACSLLLVPLVRKAARTLGAIDRPDQQRKLQTMPVALGGGVAVFAAMIIAFVGTILIDRAFFGFQLGYNRSPWYLLFGSAGALLLVGLADDIWNLRGRQKLLAQILIVAMLVGSGTVIEQIGLFGYDLPLGIFAFPVTMLWLLLAINALNLIDGADGMATTVGIIICLGLGIASSMTAGGGGFAPIVAFALAGAMAGFLMFNKPPATIYLGDAGSMMIGLFLGVLAIWTRLKEPTVLATAPIAIFALPLFDSFAAIMRRWLTGRSIYQTDRGHLHHLMQQKYGRKKMLLIVAALCFVTTTLSVLSIKISLPLLPIVGVMTVVGLLVATRTFGHAEFRLLLGKASHFASSFAITPASIKSKKYQSGILMQGAGAWETIWEPLVDFAKSHDMARVKIDLSLPWLHEGYHANWQSARLPEKASQLKICLPLFTQAKIDPNSAQNENAQLPVGPVEPNQILIGRLEIVAPADHSGVYDRFSDLVDHLAEMGVQVDGIVASLEQQAIEKRLADSQSDHYGTQKPAAAPTQESLEGSESFSASTTS
ncbi:WecA-like glycosyltransferase [Rubripirellula obstinata]|uniref:WecA-like glycosyltransferase n=1 Tax=Rubripirellula obstinata TaxID=406547 RepID=A0A5B1CHU9_9BACT|nr:MraY family glycosyltransferase [Rubripirellula obstinata]KAA1259791.1 WecA-like glycosyltransferase [Rubripirellula obstinata]